MPEWRLCSWSESTEIGKIRSRALGNHILNQFAGFRSPSWLCSVLHTGAISQNFESTTKMRPQTFFFENSGHRHPSLNILALSQPLSHIIPDLSRWSRNLPSWLLRVLFTEQHIVALIKHGLTSARVGCRLDIINICAHIA